MNNDYRPHVLIAVSFFALWLSGCTARVHGHAYAQAPDIYYEEPELVEVHPDIWVVCDHHTTVYYHSGWYWHYESGVWWRTSTWGGSRVRVHAHVVPVALVHLDHRMYVQFRGHAYAKRRRGPAQGMHHRGSAHRSSRHKAAPRASHTTTHRQPRKVAYNSPRPRPRTSPAAHRPRPATHRPRPATHRPRPATHRPRPATHRPRPATRRPRPAAHKRRPATSPRRSTPHRTRPAALPRARTKPATKSRRPSKKSKRDRRHRRR